jgi:hypothetical protein
MKIQPTQPSTFAIRSSQPANQKLQKSLSVFHRTDGQTMQQKLKKPKDEKEHRSDNRRLAQWRVKWLIEHSTSHQLLWCIDSLVLRNPPLRQAPKRWLLLK